MPAFFKPKEGGKELNIEKIEAHERGFGRCSIERPGKMKRGGKTLVDSL